MPSFDHVMVDLETTGTAPDCNAVIQITAVRFDLYGRAIDHDWFNRCMTIPPTRWWDESTRAWWMTKPETLRGIFARMEDPRLVMSDLFDWVGGTNPHFWAKPTHFDFSFTQSYFREFGPGMPFHYRKARDLNTFLSAACPGFDPYTVEFQGEEHNALFDVLHQINVLFKGLDSVSETFILPQQAELPVLPFTIQA